MDGSRGPRYSVVGVPEVRARDKSRRTTHLAA
jgi:hypothetical protein